MHKYSVFPNGFLTSTAIIMTQLVYKRNLKKKITVFLSSTILSHSHLTDDSSIKDVLQLTAAIVMASSAKKKKIRLQKFRNS